jgi:membrane-bound lytic murein transglycosylase B
VVAVAVGLGGPAGIQRAAAQGAPPAQDGAGPPAVLDTSARIDAVALELAGLDDQVQQLSASLKSVDGELAAAKRERTAIRAESSSRQQLEAQLVAQARAYAVQRYMYGSNDSTDLLAFLAALNKPADDAVWGLAALEITSQAALDQAEQVAKLREAVEERLAHAEQDVIQLTTTRARRAHELDVTTVRRADVANRFEQAVHELSQATVDGMTTVAYDAYRRAQDTLAVEQPRCGLRWELLAAIGKTESNHGAGRLDVFGNSLVPITGIPIGGDTDRGLLDGDAERDHAVGPMQFIPSTWQRWGTDANGDGRADPGNIVDAATAAGRYLCRAAGDLTLTTEAGVIRAILSYNPNQAYLRVVGARFESLANDLAAGWFSAATLPPPPPPLPDVPSNGGPDGRATVGAAPVPPPPDTRVVEAQVFGAHDLATSTTAPLPEQPGECVGASLVLAGRSGFQRCGPVGGPVSDPCEVAPYDPTLVGCLPDPTGTPILLRLAQPASPTALGPVPPYRLLVLDGGDRCLPIPGQDTGPPPRPNPTTTTTSPTTPTSTRGRGTTTTTGAPSTTAPTTVPASGPVPTETSTTAAAASRRAARQAAKAATTTTSTTSTTSATTTGGTAGRGAKAAATTTSTATSSTTTTAAPTTTTIPLALRPTYQCASGATVIGIPDQRAATWVVVVRQSGLADRLLPVAEAYA